MRATGLPIVVRLVGRRVVLLGEGEAADAKRRLLDRAGAVVVDSADAETRLAIVALDAPEQAAAALKAVGLLVNVVDRPELCDFTLPAIVDRDPVLVAVATGGASAGLAAALRQRIETLLPERLGALALALQAARGAMRARFPDSRARRLALAEALGEGGVLDPLAAPDDEAVAAWLANDSSHASARVERVTITSDDPDDLTLRAARLLASADRVVHDGSIAPPILARARADADRLTEMPRDRAAGLTVILERG
ncbi:precorrin-2 dehydrogenase/sirohydrochlorin ferrochelatase family protein [Sphingomonas baiyangensis]|uniref:precorrin-2 dehydrogenase n=1 Tax=Sphingomonas baiyangensis TaxID=2572576 RepID=A0A4U1L9J3_9SPHN|nr:NAD(P)-dependent oxidoreductase [Sphingomonas baiyangensis]TKD53233.1 siroheme synthase [Sphingomonas baiyangensis]